MTGPDGDRAARQDDLDFGGAHLHSPNFEDARITDGYFVGAELSGDITGLRVNGVAIEQFVSEDLDRQFPARLQLRGEDPAGLATAWRLLAEWWAATVERARTLSVAQLDERVDGEWSFLETLRHLIMATDSWHGRMIRHESHPYHPWGLAGSWLTDPSSLGLVPEARPTLDELLAVRRERVDAVRSTIVALVPEELDRLCVPPDAGGHPNVPVTVRACLRVLVDEEWEHHQYANRDLTALGAP